MPAVKALQVHMGSEAARDIREHGWQPNLFSLLLGASGGPKWFALSQLDRFLFGDFLPRGNAPLATLGSSIGGWRHACLAQSDPVAAITELEAGYIDQHYASKPTAEEVSAFSRGLLHRVFGAVGAAAIVDHPRFRTHIVTARARGPAGSPFKPALASGMGAAAISNAIDRRLLAWSFQRVVFHSGAAATPGLALADFHTHFAPLTVGNTNAVLHATGSIPFVLAGEPSIDQGPDGGHYWDGGIIDYHFDLSDYRGDGLILYPHFTPSLTAGWFDKFLPWRKRSLHGLKRLVLLCPTREFIATLPAGKIPSREDFTRMDSAQRVAQWQCAVAQCRQLAEEMAELVDGPDPMAGVQLLPD